MSFNQHSLGSMKIITNKLFFLCALFFILEGNAKTIFVKTDGKGNGESWENALSNLQLAIDIATESDQIWVKTGIYYPTKTNNRQIPFLIDKSVKIFGGFSGSEKALKERDFEQFQTIISGEIGDKTTLLDNSHNIFLIDIEKGDIILDGITIQRGMANISSNASNRKASGAGIFYISSGNKSSLWVSNCLFIDNQALYGGAISAFTIEGGDGTIHIENCAFQNNIAEIEGGAIYHLASKGSKDLLEIQHTTFTQNIATFGGAIYHKADKGSISSTRVSFSDFTANIAYVRGSCIYNQIDDDESGSPLFIDCSFFENKETVGNAIGDSNNIQKSQNNADRMIIRPTLRPILKRKIP